MRKYELTEQGEVVAQNAIIKPFSSRHRQIVSKEAEGLRSVFLDHAQEGGPYPAVNLRTIWDRLETIRFTITARLLIPFWKEHGWIREVK